MEYFGQRDLLFQRLGFDSQQLLDCSIIQTLDVSASFLAQAASAVSGERARDVFFFLLFFGV